MSLRLLVRIVLLGMLCPLALQAGPWPREKGTAFISNSLEVSEDEYGPLYYASSYAEYGLTPKLSFGGKIAQATLTGTEGHAFLGVSLLQKGAHALSLEVSAGQRGDSYWAGLGLAYGRGFTFRDRNGWLTAEATVKVPDQEDRYYGGLAGREAKLDFTVGLTMKNGLKTMLQLYTTHTEDDAAQIKIAPGVAIPFGERFHLEVGARIVPDKTEQSGLLVGFWQTF